MGQGKRKTEVTSSITNNGSAKITTSKGTIQGGNGLATVDKKHQIIIGAEFLVKDRNIKPCNRSWKLFKIAIEVLTSVRILSVHKRLSQPIPALPMKVIWQPA